MSNDLPFVKDVMSNDLPGVQPNEPAPLRVIPVIPKHKDRRLEFVKDVLADFAILITVYGLIYGVVYAASAGWHDAQ